MIIPLSRGFQTYIDSEDDDLAEYRWSASAPRKSGDIYAKRTAPADDRRRTILLHRVIAERMIETELCPSDFVIHLDYQSLNNRRENLRVVSRSEALRRAKTSRDSITGYKGVSYRKDSGLFVARIYHNRKSVGLGYYETAQEAHEAYCKKARELFGNLWSDGL